MGACPANVGRGPVPRQVHARPDVGEGQALALRVKRWKPAPRTGDEGPSAVGAVSNRAYRSCLANVGRGPVLRQAHARLDVGEGQALALRVKSWKPAHEAENEGPAAVGAVSNQAYQTCPANVGRGPVLR